ncbi:tumor necrosis factor receptor superfamily member 5-like [Acanthochromis polyacanthus]|uniref:tumor necrosis factor receptor superfamily member 5-like n=1 Tax=Acanthochromis polyacanthus TaxID=80966 RepID=UPI0022346889|nr:tumor necrosis factor receptor superfamily member 5-like [Acanthochromis polyacanthus]
MELMKHFVAVLMLSAHLVLTSPIERTYEADGKACRLCPPGEYQKPSCTECQVCPPGRYTTDWNREDSCRPCYRDCSPEYHLKVVQNCSATSDLKCVCESGFRCTETSPQSGNCRKCEKIQDTTTTAVTSARDEQMSSSGSSSTVSCSSPSCRSHSADHRDYSNKMLAAILCPVVVVSCVAVVILFCFRRPGDETCFRQTVAKLCNEEGQNASHKSKESTRPFQQRLLQANRVRLFSSSGFGPRPKTTAPSSSASSAPSQDRSGRRRREGRRRGRAAAMNRRRPTGVSAFISSHF